MLCDASKPFKLSVIMQNVVMPSVIMLIAVVPNGEFLKLCSLIW